MDKSRIDYRSDPDLPGWEVATALDDSRYTATLGPLAVKVIEPGRAWVRMVPTRRHSNFLDSIHGGAMLGFMDAALFAAARALGIVDAPGAVTIDLSAQFIGTATIGQPIVAEIDLLRETGRMLFMRGLVRQEEHILAGFSGTVRKSTVK